MLIIVGHIEINDLVGATLAFRDGEMIETARRLLKAHQSHRDGEADPDH